MSDSDIRPCSVFASLGRLCDLLGNHFHQHGNTGFRKLMGQSIREPGPLHRGGTLSRWCGGAGSDGIRVDRQTRIIRRSGLFRHLSTNQLELLPSISLEDGGRGRGTIKFGVPSNRRMSGWTSGLANEPQLLGIDNAR